MGLELFWVEVQVKSPVEFPRDRPRCPSVVETKSFRYTDIGEVVFTDRGKDILKFILLGDADALGDQLAANTLALKIMGNEVKEFRL